MRKTPTVIVGLLATVAIGGTAVAQNAPSHSSSVKLTPNKAGTKKKPKNVKLKLDISNNPADKTTAAQIRINLPSGLKMNTKNFPTCSEAQITDQGIDSCPSKSKLGSGTAGAVVNPSSANPTVLTFNNTFVVGGKNFLNIFLQQSPGEVRAVLKGTISKGGRQLNIVIPDDLQQPAPGVYSALTDISTTLKGTAGSGKKKHGFFELSKCSGGKLSGGKTTLIYAPNPTPPAAESSVNNTSITCKK